jgi:ubiquinone biosynthesis protein COQ9
VKALSFKEITTMARKLNTPKPNAAPAPDAMTRVLSAAMDEIAATGWARLSMEAVAQRAQMNLGDVLLHVPTTSHLLARFADHVDRVALKDVGSVDHTQSVRDRLFDLLMRRFDALQKHRAGVVALMNGIMRQPVEAPMLAARLSRSMMTTLAAAGVSAHGLRGMGQVMGLKAVYLSVLRAWQKDESTDMAKTMAALDRSLGYAERAANMSVSSLMRRAPKPDAQASH